MWSDTQLKQFNNEYLSPAQGIKHCDNSHSLYFKLLNRFVEEQKNFISQFNQALLLFRQTSVLTVQETMIRMADTLKGNAASLGANQLQVLAVELAIKSHENAVCNKLVNQVDIVLMHTLDAITKLIEMSELADEPKEIINVSVQDCIQIISRTKELLESSNIEATGNIQQLLTYSINEQHFKLLEQSLMSLEHNDFESALALINQIELT